MNNKSVSIIIPVYNVQAFLPECLDSVCKQTYEDIEIILVDDGSKDESGAICDSYAEKDSRVRVIHQPNQGVSPARNNGITLATGDFIAFVDSDDSIEPCHIENLVKAYEEGTVTAAAYFIDNTATGGSRKVQYGTEAVAACERTDIGSLFTQGLFSSIWNKLYDRNLLEAHGLRFEEGLSLGEDILFNIAYAKLSPGSFKVVNEPSYHYMVRSRESLAVKYRADFIDIQKKIYEAFLSFLASENADAGRISSMRSLYFSAMAVAIDNLHLNKNQLSADEYKSRKKALVSDPEFKNQINQMAGRDRTICSIRYFFVKNGMYSLDFGLRNLAKKILGLN